MPAARPAVRREHLSYLNRTLLCIREDTCYAREDRVARFGLARAALRSPGDCSPSAISQPELRESTFGDIPGQSIAAHGAIAVENAARKF